MNRHPVDELIEGAQTKIVMLVLDGLGGLPRELGGPTELESARTPALDALASASELGLTLPVAPGITPGSGPGHLALFGYDPLENPIGRGAMEALGADFELGPGDLAARGNFCSVDGEGRLIDRRAGRIPTELNRELCVLLETITARRGADLPAHREGSPLRGRVPRPRPGRRPDRVGSAADRRPYSRRAVARAGLGRSRAPGGPLPRGSTPAAGAPQHRPT